MKLLLLFFLTVSSALAAPRYALLCDGNIHDRDDIVALPVAMAIFSAGGKAGQVVYIEHSNHFWKNNGSQYSAMQQSAKLVWPGFDQVLVADAKANATSAASSLTEFINHSTARNPLVVIAGGPMQTIGMALSQSSPAARRYVTVVSHSTWNNNHTTRIASREGLQGPRYSFADLEEMGANTVQIHDQNGNINGTYSQYSWLKQGDSKMQWLWDRGQVAGKGNFDISDAGAVFYALTGDDDATPAKMKTLLTR